MILLEVEPAHFEWIPNSLHGILEMLAFISLIIGGLSVFFLWKADKLSKSSNEFQVVSKCMTTYSTMAFRLGQIETLAENQEGFDRLLRKYILLTTQELDYIKRKLISEEIAREWISGMIETLNRFSDVNAIVYQGVLVELRATIIIQLFSEEVLARDPSDQLNISDVITRLRQ